MTRIIVACSFVLLLAASIRWIGHARRTIRISRDTPTSWTPRI